MESRERETHFDELHRYCGPKPLTPFGYRYWRPSGLLWHTLRLDSFCNRRFYSVATAPHTLLRSLCSDPRTFMSGSVRHCHKKEDRLFYFDVVYGEQRAGLDDCFVFDCSSHTYCIIVISLAHSKRFWKDSPIICQGVNNTV